MRTLLLFLILLSGAGCKTKGYYESYGLSSFEIRMDDEDVGGLYGGATSHVEFPAQVLIDGREYRATIAAAGATTARNPRKSLTVKLKNGSYRGARKIRLAAATADHSMIRPLLGFDSFKAAGFSTPWAEPVFVHLNERVLGLYVAIETIEKEFFSARGLSWKRLYVAKADADFGRTFEGRINVAFDSKPRPNDTSAMLALLRTLDHTVDSQFEAAVFKILDRITVIDYMAVGQILNHYDGFNKNLYYYEDPKTHVMRLAPWDLDLAMAGRTGDAWNLNVLFSRIGNISPIRSEIDARIASLLAGSLKKATLLVKITEYKSKISAAYAQDPWLGRAGRSLEVEAATLARFVSDRIDTLP